LTNFEMLFFLLPLRSSPLAIHTAMTENFVLRVPWEDAKIQQTLLSTHLEQRYRVALEDPPASAREEAASNQFEPSAAVEALTARLPELVPYPRTLWGVDLSLDTPQRQSLLSSFLRAREWDVPETVSFLKETLAWRQRDGIDEAYDTDAQTTDVAFPDDVIQVVPGGDGSSTVVIIQMGAVSLEALQNVEAFLAWRIRMQERACKALSSQWATCPRGPKYTLVLDCMHLRTYHFGRACRRALSKLSHVCTHYYPDFVGETLVINAPGFLRAAWAVVNPLMPAWWGVRIGELSDMQLRAVPAAQPGCS
jgi:hypothetical protein